MANSRCPGTKRGSFALRLIEPDGLLHGAAAADAVAAGLARPLADGLAYTLARVHDGERTTLAAAPDTPPLPALPGTWAGIGPEPAVMGILNVTPDSFSDGGDHFDPGRAIAAGLRMIADGAALLDIGGESTRPHAAPVSPEEERRRVLPVLRGLRDAGVPLSIDTRHATTMAAALDAGAAIVNDVSALRHDPAAAALLAERGCPVVLMHMRGTPETMASLATYADVAVEVTRELAARIAAAEAAGIARARIAVDPGIGFAKRVRHSLEMLQRLPLLLNLGCRILVGVSRKSFISGAADSSDPKDRLPGSLAGALAALCRGAAILRVHDVAESLQAVRVWRAIAGQGKETGS